MTEESPPRERLTLPIGPLLAEPSEEAVGAMWRRHRRRSRSSRPGVWALAAAVFVALAVWFGWPREPGPVALEDGGVPPASLSRGTMAFDDGSSITLGAESRARLTQNDARWVVVALDEGSVDVEVVPGGPRRWMIETDLAFVEVVGTRFRVECRGEAVRVSVSRGTVRVRSPLLPERQRTLHAGDSAEVVAPSIAAAVEEEPAPVVAVEEPPGEPAIPNAPLAQRPDWRALADRGDHQAAWEALGEGGVARRVRTASARELFLLSDVARLAGHPADAVVPLEAIVSRHSQSPEAPTAAFTLGRVYTQLGRPAEAARAYERALALPLSPNLRGDALARLAETQRDAGRGTDACVTAQRYLSEVPSGARREAMERILATCP